MWPLLALMLVLQLLQFSRPPGDLRSPAQAFVPSGPVASLLDQHVLSGRLGGDSKLEGGCDWLDAVRPGAGEEEASRFEPLWPQGYHVTFDPLRLWSPDGRIVAREGDVVTVAGRRRPDIATICQVGPVFEVQRILAVNGRPA